MAPRLSAALIVRDEAEWLPGCLDALEGLASEIVVVDTGSADGTPDIARDRGCRVIERSWTGDFSAARNAALDHCGGAWIFVIDADERVAETDHAAFRALLDGPPAGYRFTTRNYSAQPGRSGFVPCPPGDPSARGMPGWLPSTKVRLFPNEAHLRFEGRVHELVNPSLERAGVPILDVDIPVHHYAELKPPGKIRAKQLHYLALGRAKVAENPRDPNAHAELARQLSDLGEHAAAAAAYREALALAPNDAGLLKDLGGALHLAGHAGPALQALALCVRADPELADGWRNLGVVYADGEAWEKAAECFARAIACTPEDAELHRYASIALEAAGQVEAALSAARQALALQPYLDLHRDRADELAKRAGSAPSKERPAG